MQLLNFREIGVRNATVRFQENFGVVFYFGEKW